MKRTRTGPQSAPTATDRPNELTPRIARPAFAGEKNARFTASIPESLVNFPLHYAQSIGMLTETPAQRRDAISYVTRKAFEDFATDPAFQKWKQAQEKPAADRANEGTQNAA